MRPRRGWRHSRAALTMVALASSASACAAIWGFQDGVALRDAGDQGSDEAAIDATAMDANDASAAFDGTLADVVSPSTDAADGMTPDLDDGLADDADASPEVCPGVCAPDVPGGWAGPFALDEVLDGGAPDPCGDAGWTEALDLTAGPDAAPATCDCRCAPPSNVNCGAPTASFFVDKACTIPCAAPRISLGACTAVPLAPPVCNPTARLAFLPGAPDAGSCVALGGGDASPVAWTAHARLCSPLESPGTCASGACMPAPASGDSNDATYCISQRGTSSCPASYPALHAYGDGGTPYVSDAGDDRGCTCSCGAPTGLGCNARVVLFDAGTCADAGSVVEAGSCAVPVDDFASAISTPADAGSCAPFGAPTGGLAMTDSYTLCCTR